MRRCVRTFIAVIGVVLCFAVACFVGCADDEAYPSEIYGVTAIDVNVVYDGAAHYIEPINVLENDEIYYSTSAGGEWRSERISYTTPGEYVVYYKVVRAGCADYISSAKITIMRSVLSGVHAYDAVYIYDGEPHGINIVGVKPGDSVSYSTDGENFSATCEIVEPGEYTVYYRVSDSYGDYFDDCMVTVLPNVAGKYLNAGAGLVALDNHVALVNGELYELSYGADGHGVVGEVEFAFADDGIILDGVKYGRLNDGERVYKIVGCDDTVFVAGSDAVTISVEFDVGDDTAAIKVDDNTVLTENGVNYCESIGSVELERRYDCSDVSAEVVAAGEITQVNIVTALRGVRSVELDPICVIYDGEPHVAEANTGNAADTVLYLRDGNYVTQPPSFTCSGEYNVSVVVISEEYLPAFAELEIAILPNIDGVYSNATGVVEVSGNTARRNGVAVSCEFSDGAWMIDGETVIVTEDGIDIAGVVFAKRSAAEPVLLLDFNGEYTTFVNAFNITVRVVDSVVEISHDSVPALSRAVSGDVTVTLNSNVVTGDEDDGSVVYVFGAYELAAPVVILRIAFEPHEFGAPDEPPEEEHQHVMQYVSPVAATCTTAGNTGYYLCTGCNETFIDEQGKTAITSEEYTILAVGHNYIDRLVQPTCTDDGYTEHTCKNCNDQYVDGSVPATGHDYVIQVTNPTCITEGFTTHSCNKCNDEYTDSEIPAIGHDYTTVWKHDEIEHWEEIACNICGESEEIAKQLHEYYDWECECGKRENDEYELLFEETDSGYVVTGITVTIESNFEIVIPSMHNGKDVIEIGNNAFKDNKKITGVYIPATVKRIGQRAFDGCTRLDKAEFENTQGWFTATQANASNGTSIDLSKPATNAKNLNTTYKTLYFICKK